MSIVFLVRHGESQSNAGLPTVGPEYVALTPQGREQALSVANFLESYPPDLIITSRYSRTQQTAAPTKERFPCARMEEWDVQEFTYLSSMHHTSSTKEYRQPMVDAYWEQSLPDFRDGPDSESFRAFIRRVQAFIIRLQNAASKHDTIVVFSHQQFISAVLWLMKHGGGVHMSRQTMRDFKYFLASRPIPNGGIVQMKVYHNQLSKHYERIFKHLERVLILL